MNDFIKLSLTQIPQYFMDLLELTLHPKSFLAAIDYEAADTLSRTFIFFGLTLLIANILSLPLLPKGINSATDFLLLAVLMGILQGLSVVVLKLSWKLVGGTASYRQLFTCSIYTSAPPLLLAIILSLLGAVIFGVIDPASSAEIRNHPLATIPASAMDSVGLQIYYGATLLGLLVALAWFSFAWGGFRHINAVSRTRSAIAFVISSLLTIPMFLLAVLLGASRFLSVSQ